MKSELIAAVGQQPRVIPEPGGGWGLEFPATGSIRARVEIENEYEGDEQPILVTTFDRLRPVDAECTFDEAVRLVAAELGSTR